MRGWQGVVFSLAVVAAVAALFLSPRHGAPALAASGSAGAASAGASSAAPGLASAGATPHAPAPGEPPAEAVESDAGGTLPGGQAPPALAAAAPQTVKFGVIVVGFKGAQGGSTAQRSRDEAEKLAKQLAEEAKKDFKAAIAKGDKESLEDAGRMYRNMLEPAPEYVLFSLGKGEISEPVETPRGFWILKRID